MILSTSLVLVGQLLEQPIPISNVACEPAFQPLQKRSCQTGIMASSLQHPDCLTLSQDVELFSMKKTFGFPEALLERGPVHLTCLPPTRVDQFLNAGCSASAGGARFPQQQFPTPGLQHSQPQQSGWQHDGSQQLSQPHPHPPSSWWP
jgi:hypothetical protein